MRAREGADDGADFVARGQPMTDCDFNRAALHPANPIKCRTSTQNAGTRKRRCRKSRLDCANSGHRSTAWRKGPVDRCCPSKFCEASCEHLGGTIWILGRHHDPAQRRSSPARCPGSRSRRGCAGFSRHSPRRSQRHRMRQDRRHRTADRAHPRPALSRAWLRLALGRPLRASVRSWSDWLRQLWSISSDKRCPVAVWCCTRHSQSKLLGPIELGVDSVGRLRRRSLTLVRGRAVVPLAAVSVVLAIN